MSKKDFIILADSLKSLRPSISEPHVRNIAADLAHNYPLFNHDQWVDYIMDRCTVNGRRFGTR